MQLMSVETELFTLDVQSVLLSRGYITQSIMLLTFCSVDNVLIKATPLFNQSFFQMIVVADLATVI